MTTVLKMVPPFEHKKLHQIREKTRLGTNKTGRCNSIFYDEDIHKSNQRTKEDTLGRQADNLGKKTPKDELGGGVSADRKAQKKKN